MPTLSPIRVAPSGAYFETSDSQPFLFIGPNDAITWPGLAGLYRRKGMESVEAYLQEMADSGVTILRVMLEYAHREHRYFEYPQAGRFNPSMVRLWDDLFACCEQVGLRILLAPWDNFWMARRWKRHPYNRENGGPCDSPQSFFTSEEAFAATLRRFTFVIERWGASGVLAAWDLFNEIDPHWGGTPSEQSALIARLSDGIREAEIRVGGFTRPQTVSIYGPKPAEAYESLIFAHPSLDFASTHIYEGAIDFPKDPVMPALTMGKWTRYGRERVFALASGKLRPFTDSEHGPIHLFNDHRKYLPENKDDIYERHLMWAHLASGGAGSGMRWPARHPHVLTPGMRISLRSIAAFASLVDWRQFAPFPEPFEGVTHLSVEGKAHLFGCGDEEQAIAWLLRERRSNAAVTLAINDVSPNSPWKANFWDTERGVSLGEAVATADSSGTLKMPLASFNGRKDLAVVLRRQAFTYSPSGIATMRL